MTILPPDHSMLHFLLMKIISFQIRDIFHPGNVLPSNIVLTSDVALFQLGNFKKLVAELGPVGFAPKSKFYVLFHRDCVGVLVANVAGG